MFDAALRARIDPMLDVSGRFLARTGLKADQVTVAGLACGLAAAAAVAFGWLWLALWLFVANRLADGLDGAVARATTKTDAGGFLDITSDFVFYAALPFSFAVLDPPSNALAAAALLVSFVVNGSAFFAFAALAAKRPEVAEAQSTKSFHYLWGLAEGAETIAVFAAMILFPAWFAWLAWGFAALCLVSGLARIVHGYAAARGQSGMSGKR